jgi:2-oxoglutarate dehydrogenase complex dehydrogenase (E1) component-like enzyme
MPTPKKPKRRTVTKTTTGKNDLFEPTVTTKKVVKKRKNKPTVTKTKTKSSTRASSGVTKQKTKTVGGKTVKSKTTRNYEGRPMSKKKMKAMKRKYKSSYAKQYVDMGPERPKKRKEGSVSKPNIKGTTSVTKQRRAPIGTGVKTKTVSKGMGGNYTVSKTRRKGDGTTVQRTKAVGPKRGQRVMTRRTRQVNRMR